MLIRPNAKIDFYRVVTYRVTYTIPESYQPEEFEEEVSPGQSLFGLTNFKDRLVNELKERYGEDVQLTIERLVLPSDPLPAAEDGVEITVLPQDFEDRLNQVQRIGANQYDVELYVEHGVFPTRKNHTLMQVEVLVEKQKNTILAQKVVDLELDNLALDQQVNGLNTRLDAIEGIE